MKLNEIKNYIYLIKIDIYKKNNWRQTHDGQGSDSALWCNKWREQNGNTDFCNDKYFIIIIKDKLKF